VDVEFRLITRQKKRCENDNTEEVINKGNYAQWLKKLFVVVVSFKPFEIGFTMANLLLPIVNCKHPNLRHRPRV
jgi:hypothetical protein